MTSKFSRAALVAGLAIGASGLVAVPAEAANGVSTANYYVNNPAIGPASNITPESASVSASIDTGGNPESLLPVPSTGLTWSTIAGITVVGEQWNDGTAPALTNTSAKSYAPVDGIPVSGSNSNISATITDAAVSNGGITEPGIGALSGVPQPLSNGGADNYSDVTFEYDPVSDFDTTTGQPGAKVQFAQDIQVPTTTGLSSVHTTIGAFGQAAQNNTGNTPLTPGTKYYYWVIQQAGGTDQATNINVSAWANVTSGTPAAPANNSYKCYPNAAIQADPTLASYLVPGATVTYGGQTLPASQGPCFYYYGNTSGANYYQSPNGVFTTPKLGSVKIGAAAMVATRVLKHVIVKHHKGKVTRRVVTKVIPTGAALALTNASAYKASGTIELTAGGKLAGTVKYSLQPNAKADAKIVLTARGKAALLRKQTVKVAPVSANANVASTSNWDQPLVGKSVKL